MARSLEQPAAIHRRFRDIAQALAAITAAYPEADRIRCYEYTIDDEFAREVAPLLRIGEKWMPAA
jgi:hypothetical protein